MVRVPVTVKMRIGVVSGTRAEVSGALERFDAADLQALHEFVSLTRQAGSRVAIVHARKAVLGGLSPKDNRQIPPLRYEVVRGLKDAFADLAVVVNGGFRTAESTLAALSWCDGVMLGREAYHRPGLLAELHRRVYPHSAERSREAQLERMACYAERQLAAGHSLGSITRHMLGLYAGEPGAREYRRLMSEGARSSAADASLIRRAAEVMRWAGPECRPAA